MLSDSILANVLHLAILVVGGVLLLRKIAEINGYYDFRVFVLTAIFSSPIIFFVILLVYRLFTPPGFICGNADFDY